jgi:hypothetical protein
MNKLLILFCAGLIVSCQLGEGSERRSEEGSFRIVKHGEVLLDDEQIERYDFSSQMIYLKNGFTLPGDMQEFGGAQVMVGDAPIYDLSYYQSFSSQSPGGAYLHDFFANVEGYALHISFGQLFENGRAVYEDLRTAPSIQQALQQTGKYRAGLKGKIEGWEIVGDEIQVRLSLQNQDAETYLHLDPEKMGMEAFHYFTNGLSLRQPDENRWVELFPKERVSTLGNSWQREWLSPIEGNSSKTLQLTYPKPDFDLGGVQQVHFLFPGLGSQVRDRGELIQEEGRIWLGSVELGYGQP